MKYEQALKEAEKLKKVEGDLKWKWGDLALQVEPKYSEGTLQHFAQDAGVDYSQLRKYVAVSKAFPQQSAPRGANCSWTVFYTLAGHSKLHAGLETYAAGLARLEKAGKVQEVFYYDDDDADGTT